MCINQDDGIHLQEDTTCTTRFIEAAYGKLNLGSNCTPYFLNFAKYNLSWNIGMNKYLEKLRKLFRIQSNTKIGILN